MALLSDLVANLAETTGTPAAAVTVIARSLREAGLIATGGRGRSAAQMLMPDAVSLLLGVGSPGHNTKAAEAVRAIGGLALIQAHDPSEALKALGLVARQPLRESLCHLIPATGGLVGLRITQRGGRWSARIEFAGGDQLNTLDYVEADPPNIWQCGIVRTDYLAPDVVQALYRSLNAPAGRASSERVIA